MSEKCERCGEIGEDRRMLWMACGYKMKELEIPLELVRINGTLHKKCGEKEGVVGPVPVFAEEPECEGPWKFYTMRVCKRCRANWLVAIREWFNNPPPPADDDDEGCGSGIFVRELGRNVEITLDEWNRRQASK